MDDDGAAEWAEKMLDFHNNNFNDGGVSCARWTSVTARSDCSAILERVGHGKFVRENGPLLEVRLRIKPVYVK